MPRSLFAICIQAQEAELTLAPVEGCTMVPGVAHILGREEGCIQVPAAVHIPVPEEGYTRDLVEGRILGQAEDFIRALVVVSTPVQAVDCTWGRVAGCIPARIQIHTWLSTHPGPYLSLSFAGWA